MDVVVCVGVVGLQVVKKTNSLPSGKWECECGRYLPLWTNNGPGEKGGCSGNSAAWARAPGGGAQWRPGVFISVFVYAHQLAEINVSQPITTTLPIGRAYDLDNNATKRKCFDIITNTEDMADITDTTIQPQSTAVAFGIEHRFDLTKNDQSNYHC